ncbi:MAG: serine/threonine-protein kinase [Armatimonadota bacterium]
MSSTNTLGKYEILREIARSNDIVYEAMDPTLGRHVALKELYLPGNLTGAQKRERIERFLREGKAAARLEHPNIVTVYDVGQEGDRFYIAMELLGGQTLREVIQMRGALPVKEAVDIALQLCNALAWAHQNNVVHRDVKPENVQILPGGHVKLTDFGIARIMSEPSITVDGQVFGTPSYMSPEQVSGKQIDGRSDIFALGVVLYEMLAGQKPFSGDTVVTITYNIMNSEPAAPPGMPPYLVGIVRKAMAKDPNMRFQTIEEMANELKNEPPYGGVPYADPFGTAAPHNTVPPYGGQMPGGYSAPPTTYAPPPYAPGPSAAPDPFAHVPPTQAAPLPAPIPRRPMLSAETRAFLGALTLTIGIVGMLFFAAWAVIEAYSAYSERTTTDIVTKYINQGDRLLRDGKADAAMTQYANARRVAGSTKAGAKARRRLAEVYVRLAGDALKNGAYTVVKNNAVLAVDADTTYSGGHYYLGLAYHYIRDEAYDAELRKAIETGGNDDFAQSARKMLCSYYIAQGDALRNVGNNAGAKEWYQKVLNDQMLYDPEIEQQVQDRLLSVSQ